MSPTKPKWQFVQHADGSHPTWTWTRFLLNGEVEVQSDPFPDYGKAVSDALQKGFYPNLDHWCVTNPSGTIHYNRERAEGLRAMPPVVDPDSKSVRRVEGSDK